MLTDTEIRKTKPQEKPFKLADERGLFMLVHPNGGKYWRMDYRFGEKRKTLALGVYPDVSLAKARERRDEARRLIADGVDPGEHRKVQKRATTERETNSFEAVAREWFAKFKPQWAEGHAEKIIARLEKDIFPWVGGRPIAEVTAPELLSVLRRIESRGALDTAHRAHQNCGQILRYAVATGRALRDPSADLKGALPPVKQKHFASIIEPKDIGALLRSIDDYKGHLVTRCALKACPLGFRAPWGVAQGRMGGN